MPALPPLRSHISRSSAIAGNAIIASMAASASRYFPNVGTVIASSRCRVPPAAPQAGEKLFLLFRDGPLPGLHCHVGKAFLIQIARVSAWNQAKIPASERRWLGG